MSKKLRREFYLLSRGEQRALLLVTFLLLLSLSIRLLVQFLPGREPPGIENFEREARALMAMLATADSLELLRADSLEATSVPFKGNAKSTEAKQSQDRPYSMIDLNRADSIQLLPLPGIGPVFAGRIVKYRNLLGGFLRADQLEEIYGMPPETVDRIRDRIYIDSTAIRKIHLDSATFRELLRHPYLDYDQVKALLDFREFKGGITTLKELQINQILHDTSLGMLVGYFELW